MSARTFGYFWWFSQAKFLKSSSVLRTLDKKLQILFLIGLSVVYLSFRFKVFTAGAVEDCVLYFGNISHVSTVPRKKTIEQFGMYNTFVYFQNSTAFKSRFQLRALFHFRPFCIPFLAAFTIASFSPPITTVAVRVSLTNFVFP